MGGGSKEGYPLGGTTKEGYCKTTMLMVIYQGPIYRCEGSPSRSRDTSSRDLTAILVSDDKVMVVVALLPPLVTSWATPLGFLATTSLVLVAVAGRGSGLSNSFGSSGRFFPREGSSDFLRV